MAATDTATAAARPARHFTDAGYGVLEGFLDAASVSALRGQIHKALREPPMLGCERPHNRLAPLRWNDPMVDLVLRDDRRREALARLIGATDLRWISGYVTVKDPHSAPLWGHQDWWCWGHPVTRRRAAPQVALLCYLSNTSPSRGALRVIPGSHHRSLPLHALLPEAHAQGSNLPLDHAALSDHLDQVTVAVRGGDAVVLDYRLLHGRHANESAERRDCLLLSFAPSWGDLPGDIRAHLIQHLALPTAEEQAAAQSSWLRRVLPRFTGVRADVGVNVVAPSQFATEDGAPPSR